MTYTPEVEQLIAQPLGDRTPEQVRALVEGELAVAALAHPADPNLLLQYSATHSVEEAHAAKLFAETKKFLVMGRLVGAQLAPSPEVDEFWHTWILHTKDYTAFCSKVGGYIHHKPIAHGSPMQPPLEPTVTLLAAAFGDVDTSVWPVELGARGIIDCKMGA